MRSHHKTSLLGCAFIAASMLSLTAQEPSGDQLLRTTAAKLASAQSFSYTATREVDPGLLEGLDVPEKARVSVTVRRPNKLVAHSTSDRGNRDFVFDGSTLSLLDRKAKTYTVVPMAKSIDGLVAELDEKFGFTPPLAEFALSDPYAEFKRQARTVSYIGKAKTSGGFLGMGGVECHRLALSGKLADAELWVSVEDSLPRKLVATFHREGNPQLRIAFTSWNLNAATTDADFSFTAPQGTEKIEMWSTAQMDAASRQAAASKKP